MTARAVPIPLAQVPNALTVARFALVPVFVVMLTTAKGSHSWPAGIVLCVAGVTDQVDGWLARRWRVESQFGKYADPVADRLMIDAAVLILYLDDRLPWVALAAIAARDAFLLVGARFAMPQGYEFRVSMLGKTATWILYLAVGCVIVTRRSTEWPRDLFWAGLGLACVAAVVYTASALRTIRR